jgi:hypothetical protein
MDERFSDDYTFIKDVVHYLRNGNNAQKAEYKEKLLNRYGNYIRAVIGKQIIIEYQLKEDAFNEFCQQLFDPKYLAKYLGDARYITYIYPEILASIRKVMPESEKKKAEKRQEKSKKEREKRAQKKKNANNVVNKYEAVCEESTKQKHKTKAKKYTEDDSMQYSHSTLGMRILQEDLEEFTPRQDNQEHLLGIKDLRAKLDQAIAVSILKMSQIDPKDIRIFVMNLCDYSWAEIAECMGINVNAARKRFTRSDGIQERFSALLINTLWENYKIDFHTVSRNFNALLDVE